ncbi:MAG TPA: 1,6-anhydro-N-acetylmuramyl-L-alanine amidase AmpD [Gammaproteobacteria bacterium]
MKLKIVDHRVAGIPFRESPFADARPEGQEPELVVVHGISLPPGEYGGPHVEELFLGRLDPSAHPYFAEIHGMEVSAHLFIRRDGSLVQFVPFNRRAWHAGQSSWQGRERCNDFSIGIELEGADEESYADAQYEVLAEVLDALHAAYPALDPTAITGHCDIAPGRKTDPGPGFDWALLRLCCDARRSG